MADSNAATQEESSVGWILIFTDMVALLLSFFVMLFSMSAVPVNEWETTIDILEEALNLSTEEEKDPTEDYNISSVLLERARTNVNYLLPIIEPKIKQDEIIKDSPIILLDDRIVISLSGDLLFASGKAELTEKGRKALFNLGGVLRNIRNTIGVYGYSEDEKFDRDKYTSDWELSLARAVSVANELKRAGYMEEILSFGYGGARSFKLANVSKDRRQSLSRRVDIVIMSIRGLK
ncbi:MAG TPA: chemotaxis protein MotB [Rhodospirillales bacterium]|nr:chemotaxis protein MotB [Rhodospirillales bacterium]HIB22727.1 chemotaxis protein MotB [Rhodospirillales bacterium]